MNNFYVDNFNISKINMCVFVPKGTGQKTHKNRPSHGLVIQISGIKKYVFDDGSRITAPQGSVYYLPKFSNYEVYDIDKGECIAVNFDLSDVDITYPSFVHIPINTAKFQKHFHTILSNWETKGVGYINACFATLYNIISDIQNDRAKKYMTSGTKKYVDKAVLYIQKNISDNKLTIYKISDYLGITPEYLRKLFKNTYDISPKKYIIEARLHKAKELLRSKEFAINEISRMCGYESESHFSSEFKRICGYTPSDYK